MSTEMTLAEVFLGFGGKTLYTVGTIYGIHRITGISISVFHNLHVLLGTKTLNDGKSSSDSKAVSDENSPLLTRKDFVDGFTSFGKIGLLIALGIGIKMGGRWMGLDSTVNGFNSILYK